MKIGITGTREGANDCQLKKVAEYLMSLGPGHELHHGDCRGVDIEIAAIARHLGWRIVCHPPKSNETQGFFGGDEVREPKGYLQRDRQIVDETELLIVVPLHDEWQPKGGTWYTHDYAVKKGKPVKIFYPNRKE
jgi:hypothetical protein